MSFEEHAEAWLRWARTIGHDAEVRPLRARRLPCSRRTSRNEIEREAAA
jgi:hypothetical protein